MSELTKKRKVRGGHRSYVKKLVATTKELIAAYNGEEKIALEERKIALTEKLKTLKQLDNEILNLLSGDKDQEADIDTEIEEAETLRSEVQIVILMIDNTLSKKLNEVGSSISTSFGSPKSPSKAIDSRYKYEASKTS